MSAKEGADDGEAVTPDSGKKDGGGGVGHHPVEDFGKDNPAAHPTTTSLPRLI